MIRSTNARRRLLSTLREPSKHQRFTRLRLELLEDRRLLAVDLVSVTPPPSPALPDAGNDYSTNPDISADGRFVVFQSHASNLVADGEDANETQDVFVRDLVQGTTSLISMNAEGTNSGACTGTFCSASVTSGSFSPAVSDDGRFVVFVSHATDLVKDVEVDVTPNVYVRDRDVDEDGVFDEIGESRTTLLSLGTDGTAAGVVASSDLAARPVISADGMFVSFASAAPDLLVDSGLIVDTNLAGVDVYRASVEGGAVTRINVDGSGAGTGFGGGSTTDLTIDGNGDLVGFATTNAGLISAATGTFDDANGTADIFVGIGNTAVELVTINEAGTGTANGRSREPVLSRNGRHVAFFSSATDLVSGVVDDNFVEDLFVRDLETDRTAVLSLARDSFPLATGDGATPPSSLLDTDLTAGPALSDDGRFVAFRSAAENLLDAGSGITDANGLTDIYVVDRDPDRDGVFDEDDETDLILVSVNVEGTSSADHTDVGLGIAGSSAPSISGDGRYIAFASTGRDLVSGGTLLPGSQIYLRDLLTGTTTLISQATTDGDVAPTGTTPATRTLKISRDGSRVAFQTDRPADDLDPSVTDTLGGSVVGFGETDVFVGTPDGDITLIKNFANGSDTHIQGFQIVFDDVPTFSISYYRSLDPEFDESDELLGSVSITDPELLSPTSFTQALVTMLGTGPEEIPFPGLADDDTIDDYFILAVGDPTDSVSEFDGDPFNEDNTDRVRGVYHLPVGPVFVHGSSGNDNVTATLPGDDAFELTFGSNFTYPASEVTEARVRLHDGNDTYFGSDLIDVAFGGEGGDRLLGFAGNDSLFGGPGKDFLDGGANDDTLNGGSGPDVLIGGPGNDTFFDGPGDDLIDVGLGDDIVFATPGSDDIFIGSTDIDTIDFSLADTAISLDLDLDTTQLVDDFNTITLRDEWDNFFGSPFDDKLTIRPRPGDRDRVADGGLGNDKLIVDAGGNTAVSDGTRISFPGTDLGDILYNNFEVIRVINFQLPKNVIDNGDLGFESTGFTLINNPAFPQGFDGDIAFADPNDATSSSATWTFEELPQGFYSVATTWTRANDRASDAPFQILAGEQIRVNQEQPPQVFSADGVNWLNLGTIEVTENTLTVELTDDADEFVIADAVRIEPTFLENDPIIVDDVPTRPSTGSVADVFRGSGSNLQVLTALNGFISDIGGVDNGETGGSQEGGRRRINWDDVPDGSALDSFAPDFFNRVSTRGAVVQANGELRVSGQGGSHTPERFSSLNSTYDAAFNAVSAPRLFTPIGTNETEVRFFVPGTNTPAVVSGFGAIFTDVDFDFQTEIFLFDAQGKQIGSEFATAAPGNGQPSFVGVNFDDPVIASVRITTGDTPLALVNSPNDVSQGGAGDLVVLDDFIYGEPVAIAIPQPDPTFTTNCLASTGPGNLGDHHDCLPGESATWTFSGLASGSYLVSSTWTPGVDNTTDAFYDLDLQGSPTRIVVDQQKAPDDFQQGGIDWEHLAKIQVNDGQDLTVTLAGKPEIFANAVADAIQLLPAADFEIFDPTGVRFFDDATVDLGEIALSELGNADETFDFRIRNPGSGSLTFEIVSSPTEGIEYFPIVPTHLPSQAYVDLQVRIQADEVGPITGQLDLQTNDLDLPLFTFDFKVDVVEDSNPPSVQIAVPDVGASFIDGSLLTVAGNVLDDLTLDEDVALTVNGKEINVESGGAFSITDTFSGPVEVRAVDQAGNVTEFDLPLKILPDEPPTIQLIRPFDGDGFLAGSTIEVLAEASDDVGVRRVDLFVNDERVDSIGFDTAAFQLNLPSVAGIQSIRVCAEDAHQQFGCDTVSIQTFNGPLITTDSIVVGPGAGEQPRIKVFRSDGTLRSSFFAYEPEFQGGVRVATADINFDGTADIITGPGPGGGPHVKVFSGVDLSVLADIRAFDSDFTGGVFVAGGDVTGDGFDEVIVGPGSGTLPVKVFDGQTTELKSSFFAYDPSFTGGVRVGAGDINGDGVFDVVTGAEIPGLELPQSISIASHFSNRADLTPQVDLFDLAGTNRDSTFSVAVGDGNGDRQADLIVGATDESDVPVVAAILHDLIRTPELIQGPVTGQLVPLSDHPIGSAISVAAGDVTSDGVDDVITGSGPGILSRVSIFDASGNVIGSFTPYEAFTGGVFVAGVSPNRVETIGLSEIGGTSTVDLENDQIVVRDQEGNLIRSLPRNQSSDVRLRGAPDINDLAVVRTVGEDLPRLIFDGGRGGFDSLRVEHPQASSGSIQYLRYTLDSPLITSLTTERDAAADAYEIRAVGLEPIEDELNVAEREFVFAASDDTVVFDTGSSESDNRLRLDGDFAESIEYQSAAGSHLVRLGQGHDRFVTDLPIELLPVVDGGDGIDTLAFTGQDVVIDWTDSGQNEPAQIERLELPLTEAARFTIDGPTLRRITDGDQKLVLVHDEDDELHFAGEGWFVQQPIFVDGSQRHVLRNGDATLEVINSRPFRNPLAPTDINFNGGTNAIDALQVINFLARNEITPVDLAVPTDVSELAQRYLDSSGDGRASALDALIVINFLARANRFVEAEPEGLADQQLVLTSQVDPCQFRDLSTDETVYLPLMTRESVTDRALALWESDGDRNWHAANQENRESDPLVLGGSSIPSGTDLDEAILLMCDDADRV